MKKNCFIFMLLVFAMSYGQDETTNWYFGRGAGLQFNNDGSVTPLTNGKIETEEGCASISDETGNLLFYTDGITVYNGNHEIMPNGTGLYGDPSSTQSALIVPAPASDTIFYIFTVDTSISEGDPNYGFNFSTVDISLNGGKGEVILKNSTLLPTCSEKITAVVKDCADESIWVMTLSTLDGTNGLSDTFHAFEVNGNGVNTNAVKSTFPQEFGDRRGNLKFSINGEKMASANEFDGLYLYDFNAETGQLANPQKLNISAPYKNPYSVEFSPNNQFLYVHTHSDAPALESGHNSNLLQFDLLTDDISASEIILDEKNIYRGALQLGANGKIYRTITESYLEGTEFLGVIENPNQKGNAASYKHNAVFLQGGIAMQGLPPFVQSFFAKEGLFKNADGSTSTAATLCEGDQVVMEAEAIADATYIWEHNGVVFENPLKNVFQIDALQPDQSGQYRLTVLRTNNQCELIGEAQIQINEPPLANDYSLSQCDIDEGSETASSDGVTVFNLEQAIAAMNPNTANSLEFYRTLFDQENNIPIENISEYVNETPNEQTLFAKITDENGCTNEASLLLEVSSSPADLVTGEIFYSCDTQNEDGVLIGVFDLLEIRENNYAGLEVDFFGSRSDAALEKNPITEANYSTTSTSIFARVESMNQCLGVEELEFLVNPTPTVTIDSEFLICTNDPNLVIEAEQGFDTYSWFKIDAGGNESIVSNEAVVNIIDAGEYRLELGWYYANNTELCTNSGSFSVVPSNRATISNIEIEDLRENNMVTVMATGDGDYEYAVGDENGPYQDNNIIENVPPGETTVYVRDKNGCGIVEENISIIGFPKFFTPNGDGVNESWNLIGVPDQQEVSVSIYDRYGKLIHQVSQNNHVGWDGTFNGKLLPASDYWFKIQLEEGRIFQGHFSLKR